MKIQGVHKVIICGDREWHSQYGAEIRRVVRKLKRDHGRRLLIIQGGASGVDEITARCAEKEGVHCAEVNALWQTFGRSAGPQRNRIMLALEPDEVIGFHLNWKGSKGTEDMCHSAELVGIPTRRVKVKF